MNGDVASLRRELAELRREVRRSRAAGWRSRLAMAALALSLVVLPASIAATDRFPDVPTANPHHNDVNQIAAVGITIGFPDGTYQPDAFVTRGQMASFLARTAGLGGRTPVVNAATALTATNATNATNAVSADKLDGFDASGLSRVNVGALPGQVPIDGTFRPLAVATLTIPAPGFVYVTGAATALTSNEGGQISEVGFELRDTTSGARGLRHLAYVGTINGTAHKQTVATTWVFQVSAAGARSFALDGSRNPFVGIGPAYASNSTISVLYVPFGPGGVQGADLSVQGNPISPSMWEERR